MNQVVLFGDSEYGCAKVPGMYVLASHLRSQGISVQTIWGWVNISELEFKALCKRHLSKETKIIGLSTTLLTSSNIANFYGVTDDVFESRVNFIKKISPEAKIVIGGSKTRYSSVIPKVELIDHVVMGQGETALLELITNPEKYSKDKYLSDVEVPYNTFSNDSVTFGPQDCIQQGEAMFIEFARGCIFKCSFCNYHLTGKKRGDYTKDLSVLKSTLIKNYEMYGIQHYAVSDDLINDSQEKVDDIYNVTQQLPFKIYYSGYTRLDLFRRYPDMAKQLKESGLIGTFFGIETINDASGKVVGKGLGLERTNQALEVCYAAWQKEVVATGSFILGLPYDTTETKTELTEWLDLPATRNVLTDVLINPMHMVLDGQLSEIAADPDKFGYSFKDESAKNSLKLFRKTPHYCGDWVTEKYSYAQAIIDAKEVQDAFYKNNKYKRRIDIFSLPLYLSLFGKDADKILQVLTKDISDVWSFDEEWGDALNNTYAEFRKRYIVQMISK